MMAAANCIPSTGIVLEPLRKDNYNNWRTLVRNYLVGQGLWDGVVGFGPPRPDSGKEDDWVSRNAKALHAIQLACGSEYLSSIRTFEDARDAWNHLNISFSEDRSIAYPDIEQGPESQSETEFEHVDSTWIDKLHSDVKKGNWKDAKACIDRFNDAAILSTTPPLGRTILHVAVASGRERIVEELLSMGNHSELEIQELLRMQDKRGYTALALVAELTDNEDVAEWMVDKGGRELLSIKTRDGEIPILLAAAKGHKRMTRYLFSQTPVSDMIEFDYRGLVQAATLFTRCISLEIFDVAASLLHEPLREPLYYGYTNEPQPTMALAHMPSAFRSGTQLGWWSRFIYNSLRLQKHINLYGKSMEIVLHDEPDEEVDTNISANLSATHPLDKLFLPVKPLGRCFGQFKHAVLTSVLRKLPGSEKIYEMKLNHYLALEILEWLSTEISKYDKTALRTCSVYDCMLLAAKYGIIELIDSMRHANPDLLWVIDENKKGILSQSICHRQEKVFQLILGIQGQKEINASREDSFGNNMLHLAAELGPSSYLSRMSNPALQMQKELQWFNAVERIVPPRCKETKNIDGMTPHELFTKKHEDLMKAGEQWARHTASSFTLVGTLIITIMFAAAFTVPGGNDQNTGTPIFLRKRAFLVFIIADTISLIMSSSSVLIFIEILTSRYAMKDFLKSLHYKIVLGLFTLFFSVTSMMLTFVAALSLMLKEYPGAVIAATSLAIIPVLVLVRTLLSLSYEILKSTWTWPDSRVSSF